MQQDIKQLIDNLKTQGTISNEDAKKRTILTLSKVPGAGGREIAEIVAKRLGLDIYEKTIVTKLAEYTGTDKEAFSIIADVIGDSKDFWLYRIFGGEELSHDTIRRHLTNVIQALARSSNCIMIGRGSHIPLKELADIRIRITAPMDFCIDRIMKTEKCDKETATETYQRNLNASGKFVWNIFNSRLNDPTNFDLILNTEKLNNFEACADIIINAMDKIEKK